ncbi:MAG TPA: YceH family protein [Solirubrobacteraceae bacterium]|nr:YceH family protein [Solirubrobacteraceae bacterium]
MDLTAAETRVLGCLLEKQRTTPDAYPLSLNALRLACNQSTNREPVVEYDEATIRDALHRLERRRFVRLASGAGSRAAKYRHLLDEALPIDEAERAILCVLMLRGPQTPGELKQRAERMHAFAGLGDVHDALARLIARELAIRLQRRPGQKEERYAQLLEDQTQDGSAASADANGGDSIARPEASRAPGAAESARGDEGGLEELRERVERLEGEVAELRSAMRNPSPSPSTGPAHEPPRFDPRL